jgi:hypothetical protein
MIKGESRGGEKKQQGTGCESESGENFPHREPHGKATYPLAQAENSARPLDFSPLALLTSHRSALRSKRGINAVFRGLIAFSAALVFALVAAVPANASSRRSR